MPSAKEIKIARQEAYERLRDMVDVEPGTPFEVTSEAMEHLLDNYRPNGISPYDLDCVLLLANGSMGKRRDDGSDFQTLEMVYLGNYQELARCFAAMMRDRPEFARIIFEAVHMYATMNRGGGYSRI